MVDLLRLYSVNAGHDKFCYGIIFMKLLFYDTDTDMLRVQINYCSSGITSYRNVIVGNVGCTVEL